MAFSKELAVGMLLEATRTRKSTVLHLGVALFHQHVKVLLPLEPFTVGALVVVSL
jgi:hypothetical protein